MNKPESRSTIKAGKPAMKLRKNIHKTGGILNIQITFESNQIISSFSTYQLCQIFCVIKFPSDLTYRFYKLFTIL